MGGGVVGGARAAPLTPPPKPFALAAVVRRVPALLFGFVAAAAVDGCGKDPPLVAPVAETPAVVPLPAPLAPQNAPLADDEEAAPAGPAVEVNVAADPAQPLAWYRGLSSDRGHENALWFSRKPTARKPVTLEDGAVALRGPDKPNGARKGPAKLLNDRPLLVSVGAKWCKPCADELGDVFDLARQIRGDAPDDAVGLLFILEGAPDEWPVAEVRDELVAKHAKAHKLAKPLAVPLWVEFRADIGSAWGDAVKQLALLGGGTVALPLNVLLDKCGHVQAAATGSLDAKKKAAFVAQAAKLATAACVAAPVLLPPVVRPVVAPKPKVPEGKGDHKLAPATDKKADDKKADDKPEGLKLEPKEPTPDKDKPAVKDEPKAAPKPEAKEEPKAAAKPEPRVEPKAEPKPEPKGEPKPEPKAEPSKGGRP